MLMLLLKSELLGSRNLASRFLLIILYQGLALIRYATPAT